MSLKLNRTICLAPMMGYTDRHFRYLLRLISSRILLYTEMYTVNDVFNNPHRLEFDDKEHPLAVQLGGSDPLKLAQCSKLVSSLGFDEINLNVGCPSSRVQEGKIGACLMKEPRLVADCWEKMQAVVNIPVTIKCRLGVDDQENYDDLVSFVEQVSDAGCRTFIIHARKAWLKGLNPKQNRTVPALKYDWVCQLKREFPHLTIILNGGISSVEACMHHLEKVDGVMLGRAVYQNPWVLTEIEGRLNSDYTRPTRGEILEQFLPYMNKQVAAGVKLTQIVRHLFSLFHGKPGAKEWRKTLSTKSHERGSKQLIEAALAAMHAKAAV